MFSYRLDLVVRLVDVTNGCPVKERQVLFSQNGQAISLFFRGPGIYVLINGGRKNGKLTVAVRGYLETTVDIRYEKMTGRYPELYVQLIPKNRRL